MAQDYDQLPSGYLSFQDDGIVTEVNEPLATILELSKADIVGHSIENLMTVASRIFYNTHLFPLIKLHGEVGEIFISLRSKSKKDIPVLLNGKRTETGTRASNTFILILIHQRKQYEDKLLEAKRNAERAIAENEHLISLAQSLELRTKELDEKNSILESIHEDLVQFSKIMSHDLQETLHKLNVFTDKLSLEVTEHLSDKAKATVQKILTSSLRSKALINGLHEFIQISTVPYREPVNLWQILEQSRIRAEQHSNISSVTFEISENLSVIDGNPEQLEMLFYQLLLNAIQYRKPEVPLVISVEAVRLKENTYRHNKEKYKYTDHIKLIIKDNGSGFDNTLNEFVFGLLRKVNPQSLSTGIGLALSRKIVQNHQGTISIQSQPGIGSEVTVLLPLQSD